MTFSDRRLSPARQHALQERVLRMEKCALYWHGASRAYHKRIVRSLLDQGALRLDLDADPWGRTAVPVHPPP